MKKPKHEFLRRVVILCLIMMILLTLHSLVLAWVLAMPVDPTTFVALMSGWCGELLLTLLKRKFEKDDERERGNSNKEDDGDAG